jgi:hypothetical protein
MKEGKAMLLKMPTTVIMMSSSIRENPFTFAALNFFLSILVTPVRRKLIFEISNIRASRVRGVLVADCCTITG